MLPLNHEQLAISEYIALLLVALLNLKYSRPMCMHDHVVTCSIESETRHNLQSRVIQFNYEQLAI